MRFRRGRINQKSDNHPRGRWGKWIQWMRFKVYGPEDDDDYQEDDYE